MNSVGLCLRGSRSAYNNGDNKESMNRDASTTEGMLNIKIQTIKLCYSYSQCKDVSNFMSTCLAPLTQHWNIFYCWFEFNYNNILYLYIPLLLLIKKLKIPYPHINKHSILIRNTPPSLSLQKPPVTIHKFDQNVVTPIPTSLRTSYKRITPSLSFSINTSYIKSDRYLKFSLLTRRLSGFLFQVFKSSFVILTRLLS